MNPRWSGGRREAMVAAPSTAPTEPRVTDLLAARTQMAISLGFHILFAVAGMAMPMLMVMSEWRFIRTGQAIYRDLAVRWAKGTAILFAVGAVSGTVLSFELGLLWPAFMEHAGPLIGLPFSLEGFAFFLEAIFLGLYLYGWDRLRPAVHLACGGVIALSGIAGGVLVMAVNAFMNTPPVTGLEVDATGAIAAVDPYTAFSATSFPTQALHMVLAAYVAVSFAVMGIHAWSLLRDPKSRFHRAALGLTFALAAVATPLQIASGDLSAKHLAEHQPLKLAAAEGLFETTTRAPLTLGGWPDTEALEVRYAIELPGALSFLGKGDFDAEIQGLLDFPRDLWPPVPIVKIAFQIMVACGFAMLAVVLAGAFVRLVLKTRLADSRPFLRAALLASPLGLLALEAGWVVTEVGRQPWIIQGVMKVADAVTPMPHLVVPLTIMTAIYLFLGVIVVLLLRAHVFSAPRGDVPDEAGHPGAGA